MITVKRLRELLAGVDDDARVTIEDGDYWRDAGLSVSPRNGGDGLLIEVGRFNAPDHSQSPLAGGHRRSLIRAGEIVEAGAYWWFDPDDYPAPRWRVVEVIKENGGKDLIMLWPGSDLYEDTRQVRGEFLGPLPEPTSPPETAAAKTNEATDPE